MTIHHILVVEDESSIAETIEFALKKADMMVTWVMTAREARHALTRETFSAIVLDVGLPDTTGFDLCQEIRKTSNIPLLFLTARSDEIERVLGLEIGGDDYITKPFSPRELVARIKAVVRRNDHSEKGKSIEKVPSESKNVWMVDNERAQIAYRGNIIPLSRYEHRLLLALVNRPGKVFSRSELMSRAWEEPDMSLERTVDTHIKTIRSKIRSFDDSYDPIITHRGFGYSLKEESD